MTCRWLSGSRTVHPAKFAAVIGRVPAALAAVKDELALTTVGLVALTAVDYMQGTCRTLSKSQSLGYKRTARTAYLVQFPHTHSDG